MFLLTGAVNLSYPVNLACPLNRGLVSWWLPLPGQQYSKVYRDICLRNHATLINGATLTGPKGRRGGFGAANFIAASSQRGDIIGVRHTITNQVSVAAWVNLTSTGDYQMILSAAFGAGDGSEGFELRLNDSGQAQMSVDETTGRPNATSSGVIVGTGWVHLLGTYDGSLSSNNIIIYVNGAPAGTGSGTGNIAGLGADWMIGGRGGSFMVNGLADSIKVWNRSLSASEALFDYSESVRAHPETLNWHCRPAFIEGTVSYIITIDSENFSLTGTDSTLKVDRKLTADSGSFNLTGTDVALKTARTINLSSGNFSLTGTDASLKTNRLLIADSNLFTLTGSDTSLELGYKLTSDSGTFNLTGSDSALKFTRLLSTETNSFVLSGSAATLKVERKVNVDSGSFVISGEDTGASQNPELTADSGAFNVAATTAGLLVGRKLQVDSASIQLTLSSAQLLVSRLLTSVSGTFNLIGTTTNLRATRIISQDSGVLNITGTETNLIKGRRIVADISSYAFSGSITELKTARRLLTLSTSFTILGQPVNFQLTLLERFFGQRSIIYGSAGYRTIVIGNDNRVTQIYSLNSHLKIDTVS